MRNPLDRRMGKGKIVLGEYRDKIRKLFFLPHSQEGDRSQE
jgi:hypothetical protein